MIKAVLFDFRDTLLRVDNAYEKANVFLYKFLKRKEKLLTPAKFESQLSESINRIKKKFGRNTKIHDWSILFISRLLKSLDVKSDPKGLDKLAGDYDDIFTRNVKLFPDARYVLNFLKEKGVRMGVVIDGPSRRERKIIKKLGLIKYFSAVAISEEIGQNKFSDLPLKAALKAVGSRPQETIVVGDRIDKDIIHANKLGCVSVKLERHGGRYTNRHHQKPIEKPKYAIANLKELTALL